MAKGSQFPTENKALRGRSVMITRQRNQAAEIAAILENAGASIIYCPTIEIAPPDSWAALDDAIHRIGSYDWIVFTSANGVKLFDQRLREWGLDISIINSLVSCAIGPATAAALQAARACVDVTATDSRAEGALQAIIRHAGGAPSVKGLRFLMPRAQVARELLPTELRALGAIVDAVDAYKTIKPAIDSQAITRLLEQRHVDVVTFTSPSTVAHFADLIRSPDLPGLLKGVLIACIGPLTAAAARERGLKSIIQPESHDGEALARAIIDALAPETGRNTESR